jgi:hypothetical protein
MVPTSTLSMYKVFDNVHMLWMGIWIHHHAITTAVVGPDLGRRLKSDVTAGLLVIPFLQWLKLKTHLEWFPHLL